MNYIEAAARAVENMACALAREGRKSDRYGFCGHARCGHFHEAADAIRALAHAARGEGEERPVHRDDEWWIRRINEAHKHGGLPWLVTVAKNFPRDEGASATPPPATGEAKWPEIRDSGGRTDFALTPATGEAGTREAEIRKDERERCAKVCRDTANEYREDAEKWREEKMYEAAKDAKSRAFGADGCAIRLSAPPEAREGKS